MSRARTDSHSFPDRLELPYNDIRLYLGSHSPEYRRSKRIWFSKVEETGYDYDLRCNCPGDDGDLGVEAAPYGSEDSEGV